MCEKKSLTTGKFAVQQPSYQVVSKLWIVVFILVEIICAVILKRREKPAKQLSENTESSPFLTNWHSRIKNFTAAVS